MLFPCTERDQALTAAGVAGMSPYYEAALPSANSVASIIPALTAYANAAMPHLAHLGPITFGPPLAQAARQVRPLCQFTNAALCLPGPRPWTDLHPANSKRGTMLLFVQRRQALEWELVKTGERCSRTAQLILRCRCFESCSAMIQVVQALRPVLQSHLEC